RGSPPDRCVPGRGPVVSGEETGRGTVILARRGSRGPDPFLGQKVQIFLAGAALALVGIGVDSSLLVGLAILILLAGVGLRFLAGRKPASSHPPPEDGEASEQEKDVDPRKNPNES
ncbi:MAG: hypothetical protein ACWGSQ_17845, partial [Longimicrobiales bacterium]